MKEKIKEFIIKNLKWIILFICLIGFLALAEDVFNKEIMNGDIIGYKMVSTFLISGFATPVAKFITNFGGAIFLILTAIESEDYNDKSNVCMFRQYMSFSYGRICF